MASDRATDARPVEPAENDTIAYTGQELLDLLTATNEHEAEWLVATELEREGEGGAVAYDGPFSADVDVCVESTVVIAGPLTRHSFVGPPPSAPSSSRPSGVVTTPPPVVLDATMSGRAPTEAGPTQPSWRWGPSVAAFGILVGGFVAMLVNDAQAFGSIAERRAERVVVEEKTPLAGAVRAKAEKAVRPMRPAVRRTVAAPQDARAPHAERAPAMNLDAIGEAQLVRPF
ncbi:MAG: hypothetical protein KF819_19550 [Labilithrix sp.]|nr:hypothetical protein [Labilithrix sp.]